MYQVEWELNARSIHMCIMHLRTSLDDVGIMMTTIKEITDVKAEIKSDVDNEIKKRLHIKT